MAEKAEKIIRSHRRCPNCGSTNLQTEPLYQWEWEDEIDDEADLIALFCVSCGHYLGEVPTALKKQGAILQNRLLSDRWLPS